MSNKKVRYTNRWDDAAYTRAFTGVFIVMWLAGLAWVCFLGWAIYSLVTWVVGQ